MFIVTADNQHKINIHQLDSETYFSGVNDLRKYPTHDMSSPKEYTQRVEAIISNHYQMQLDEQGIPETVVAVTLTRDEERDLLSAFRLDHGPDFEDLLTRLTRGD